MEGFCGKSRKGGGVGWLVGAGGLNGFVGFTNETRRARRFLVTTKSTKRGGTKNFFLGKIGHEGKERGWSLAVPGVELFSPSMEVLVPAGFAFAAGVLDALALGEEGFDAMGASLLI